MSMDSIVRITEGGIGVGRGNGGAGSPSALRPLGTDCADGNKLLEFLPPITCSKVKLNRIENPTEMKMVSILFMDKVLLRSEVNSPIIVVMVNVRSRQ